LEVAVSARVAGCRSGCGQSTEDGHTGSGQVHRIQAPIGKAGLVVAVVAGGDGDDVLEVEVGRIRGDGVVVGVGIAGDGDEEDAAVALLGNGGLQRRRGRTAPAVVGDQDVVAPIAHHVDVVD
jgi:hypothetical protein